MFLTFNQAVFAKTDCETVKFNKAEQCKNIEVWIDFSECENQKNPEKLPLKVNCRGGREFAEAKRANALYKVKLEKKVTKGAWGATAVHWIASTRISKVSLLSNNIPQEPKVEKVEKVEASREPAAIRPNESTPPPVAEGTKEPPVKVNGFVDAQYQQNSRSSLTRGFLINDGAVYITSEIQNLDFKIDLPFRMYTNGNPNFEFGLTRAQAYLGQKYSNGLRWKIGQFDTTFGFEGNDTTDITFSRQGNVYNYTDPFVHTGLVLGYDFNSEWGVNAYVANPNDRGVLTGKNIQYGLQLVKSSPVFRFAPGFLLNTDATTQKLNIYGDVVVGVTAGIVALDAEVSYNYRTDIINPETNDSMQGIGALLHLVFNVTDAASFGVRGEYITNQALTDPKSTAAQPTLKSQILVFVGPQYYVTKNIRLKLDYSYQSDTQYLGAGTLLSHGLQLGGVFRF